MIFIKSFDDIIDYAKLKKRGCIAIAAAAEESVLEAVVSANKEDLADFVLVGDENKIKQILSNINPSLKLNNIEIINEKNPEEASSIAVQLVKSGKADALMKGLVDTSVILKSILNKENGIRDKKKLSHIAVFELNSYHKLLFLSDAAMNIAPNLEDKKEILENSINAIKNLNIDCPNIAAIAAKEKIDNNMPATIDAYELAKWANSNFNCIAEGPLALDNAVSKNSVKIKEIDSKIAGEVDLLICPNIESGNILYKSLSYLANAESAGVILGAKRPIILTSRADSARSKLVSIALSIII